MNLPDISLATVLGELRTAAVFPTLYLLAMWPLGAESVRPSAALLWGLGGWAVWRVALFGYQLRGRGKQA